MFAWHADSTRESSWQWNIDWSLPVSMKQYSSPFRSRLSAWGYIPIKELLTGAFGNVWCLSSSPFEILNKKNSQKHECQQSINHKRPTIRWKKRENAIGISSRRSVSSIFCFYYWCSKFFNFSYVAGRISELSHTRWVGELSTDYVERSNGSRSLFISSNRIFFRVLYFRIFQANLFLSIRIINDSVHFK